VKLVPDHGVVATTVECPTCFAWVGWACGAAHCDGAHRMRIRRALHVLGRVERRAPIHAFGQPFFLDPREGHYYDAIPGYRSLFVRRVRETTRGC